VKLEIHPVRLPLKDRFTISRESIDSQDSVIVALSDGEYTGYGEVSCNSYYGHTIESLIQSFQRCLPVLERSSLTTPESLFTECRQRIPNDFFALSAIDCAAHDLSGKKQGVPTWQALGLNWNPEIRSSYTLGIDSIEEMRRKFRNQPNWSIYKIKLGTSYDLEIVSALREETDAVIRVDANCAWSVNEAIEKSHALAELGVEFIEQPLPADVSRDEQRAVYERSALPIIADESCQVEADVVNCHGLFHGINVKICKCGGLTPAVRMLKQARSLGLKTMVGCMIESSVGISAAAQLLPLLDYADLDGSVLIAQDPATGVRIENGKVIPGTLPGCGIQLNPEELSSMRFDPI